MKLLSIQATVIEKTSCKIDVHVLHSNNRYSKSSALLWSSRHSPAVLWHLLTVVCHTSLSTKEESECHIAFFISLKLSWTLLKLTSLNVVIEH